MERRRIAIGFGGRGGGRKSEKGKVKRENGKAESRCGKTACVAPTALRIFLRVSYPALTHWANV